MNIDGIMLWVCQNSVWAVPMLYMIMMGLIAVAIYITTHQFLTACMVEGSLALVFIFLIYIPFRHELSLEISSLLAFITVVMVCLLAPFVGHIRD